MTKIALFGFMIVMSCSAQAVRFDTTVDTTSSTCVSGKQCALLVIPGATVSVCGGSVTTLSSCLASPATTYTDYTAGTPCPTTAQLTPATGGSCLATSDAQGGAGFWALPGQYNYFLRVPATAGGGTYGPYPINVGASAGCPLGATCDANFSTLSLACTAAGTGTLYVTRVWNSTPSQTLGCGLQFLGNGKVVVASSATIASTGNVSCPTFQQCFDTTTNSGAVITFAKLPPNINHFQFGAVPDCTGSSGTDSSPQVQATVNAIHASGGGSMLIPWTPLPACAENITYYSDMTFYGDVQQATIRKPSNHGSGGVDQVFTSNNGSAVSGGALLTNVHFNNFTIDGNQANQTGLSVSQNGLHGIFMAASDSSVTNMVLKNAYTDNLLIDGAGTQTATGTTDTVVNTCTITDVTWSGGIATYTCSADHGLVAAAPLIIASVSPSGYNFTSASPCSTIDVPTSTTFTCRISSDPGSYVSGGTVTSYEMTNITGPQNFATGATVTINSVAYVVGAYVSATSAFLNATTSPGNQTGVSLSVSTYNEIGSNVLIQNNLITAARRNNISVDAGNYTTIQGNHISYGGLADCTGTAPKAGVDREPYRYGNYYHGFRSIGNEIDHNCGNGISIYAENTFDALDSPVTSDWVHDNGGFGVYSPNFQASTGILLVSGLQQNNATTAGVSILGWTNAKYNGVSYGTARGILLGPRTVNMQIGCEAVLNGTVHDISVDGPNANAILCSNNTLANTYIQGGEEVSVRFPVTIVPQSAKSNGFIYWPGDSPRTGKAAVSTNCTMLGTQSNPNLRCTNPSDATAIPKMQATSGFGAIFVNEANGNAVLGANNSAHDKASLTITPAGTLFLGLSNFASIGACSEANKQAMAVVNDSTTQTWGAVYTGGGAFHARVSCDGSNWTVFSK